MQHPDEMEEGDLQLSEPGRMCYNVVHMKFKERYVFFNEILTNIPRI